VKWDLILGSYVLHNLAKEPLKTRIESIKEQPIVVSFLSYDKLPIVLTLQTRYNDCISNLKSNLFPLCANIVLGAILPCAS